MPRTFALSAQYPVSVEQIYAAFADERYWRARLAESGADTATLDSMTVDAEGGVDVTTTEAIHHDKLPALAAQFHPGDLVVTREEKWSPLHDGRTRASINGRVVGAPATVTGDVVLEPADAGCRLDFTATVQVDIPLLGGKIESFIGAQLIELVAAEQRFTATWLGQGGEPQI